MLVEQSKRIEQAHKKNLIANRGKKVTPKQLELLKIVEEFPDIGNKNIMILLGITRSTLKEHIEAVEMRGFLKVKVGYRGIKSYRVIKSAMKKI
mgnify:CR=1 FL=1|jgi:DNA-binding MarR family transcriptional regulator